MIILSKEKPYMLILLISFPFIDFLTSIATWENLPSIGLFIKSILLGYATFYLLKNSKQKRKIYILFSILILYGLISSYFFITDTNTNLIMEYSNLIKIFYLPILLLFFNEYENPKITKKTITILLLLYLLLYLIPYPFGLGHNINEVYPNKNLYLSYFYIGNEIANIFILLIPISLTYLIENQKKFLFPVIFLIIAMLLLLGTKAMYLSIIIVIIFFIIYYRKKIMAIVKKHWIKFLVPILLIIISLYFYLPRSSFYHNIQTTFEFYNIEQVSDLISIDKIDNVIFSNRLTFLNNINKEYTSSSLSQKLFGLGRTKIHEMKDIEIDLFDIFYSIGIIGFIIYLVFFAIIIRNVKLSLLYKFVFILIVIISLFSGHVLVSPMVSTYIALLPLISKNEGGKNERMD